MDRVWFRPGWHCEAKRRHFLEADVLFIYHYAKVFLVRYLLLLDLGIWIGFILWRASFLGVIRFVLFVAGKGWSGDWFLVLLSSWMNRDDHAGRPAVNYFDTSMLLLLTLFYEPAQQLTWPPPAAASGSHNCTKNQPQSLSSKQQQPQLYTAAAAAAAITFSVCAVVLVDEWRSGVMPDDWWYDDRP
jgi:hypothetical protein